MFGRFWSFFCNLVGGVVVWVICKGNKIVSIVYIIKESVCFIVYKWFNN